MSAESQDGVRDRWAKGDLYQPFIGRWSLEVAAAFVPWLGAPAGVRWLDVGCGTGSLSRKILELGSPESTYGIDPSEGFVKFAREIVPDRRATFDAGAVESHRPVSGPYGAVVSGLVLNFVPDPAHFLQTMVRLASPGGIIGAYVWDALGGMEILEYFWNAAIALDPEARKISEANRFHLCRPEPLKELFEGRELQHVELRAIDIQARFRDFDDYWLPFLGGQGPAPTYAMSLSEARRSALRERLRGSLPMEADASILLNARAWAIKGMKGNL